LAESVYELSLLESPVLVLVSLVEDGGQRANANARLLLKQDLELGVDALDFNVEADAEQ